MKIRLSYVDPDCNDQHQQLEHFSFLRKTLEGLYVRGIDEVTLEILSMKTYAVFLNGEKVSERLPDFATAMRECYAAADRKYTQLSLLKETTDLQFDEIMDEVGYGAIGVEVTVNGTQSFKFLVKEID